MTDLPRGYPQTSQVLEGGGVGSRDTPGTLSYALSKETILLSRLRAVAAQCASKNERPVEFRR